MSVLARKYRYLPPASNAGVMASARPSVSWKDLPSARECTKIARRWLSLLREYAIQRESGDHTASKVRPGVSKTSVSTFVERPLATSITQRLSRLSSNRSSRLLGDHASSE